MKTQVTYFLPRTMVRLQAHLVTVTDTLASPDVSSDPSDPAPASIGPTSTTRVDDWTAEVLTAADPACPRTVVLATSPLFDYGIKLSLTEDGRLTSASVDTTGQVGRVLASAAGLAVTLASAGSCAFSPRSGGILGDEDAATATPADRTDPYAQHRPQDAHRLAALTAQHIAAQQALHEARDLAIAGTTDDSTWRDYQRLRRVADDVSTELDRAKALRDAWRRGTTTTVESVEVLTVSPADLPLLTRTGDAFVLTAASGAAASAAWRFYTRTGHVLAVVAPDTTLALPADIPTPASPQRDVTPGARLHLRRPRPLELATVHRDGDAVVVTEVQRVLVMDAACEELVLPIRRSWLAKRRTSIDVSALGALVGVQWGGDSAAAGAASALSDAQAGALAALSSADKARAALGSLAAADETDALAHLKRSVALDEQRLLAEGQAATAADHARLERLKLELALAETEAKLAAARR